MKNVIRVLPGLLTPINGVEFHPLGELSISAPVSAEDADVFCAVPGFRLAADEEVPDALRSKTAPAAPVETKAQKAAREKAEKAEADKLAAAEADRLAAEKAEADRLAAEQAEADRVAAEAAAEAAKLAAAKLAEGKDDSEVF